MMCSTNTHLENICDTQEVQFETSFGVGTFYESGEILNQKLKDFARENGFIVAVNSHKFLPSAPHPIHGPESNIWQRGTIYCNFKDPQCFETKSKSSCSWSVSFGFSRDKAKTVIKKSCLIHNHTLENVSVFDSGNMQIISLDANLIQKEHDTIIMLSRYNLKIPKVWRRL